MIVRINGQVMSAAVPQVEEESICLVPGINPKLRRLAITLWCAGGAIMTARNAMAATTANDGTDLWEGMFPVFGIFQSVGMVICALAIMVGLVILVFKKHWGLNTIKVSSLVVLGVFLVPAAVMLLAIIGGKIDDVLEHTFQAMKHKGA